MARAATRRSASRGASIASQIFSGAFPSPETLVAIPPAGSFNVGLSFAPEATMKAALGIPGALTRNCSPCTGPIKSRIVTVNVGPFRVSGIDTAVSLLKLVFEEAEQQIPDVVAAVKTAGMLCCRAKRTNPNSFSNHSWGTTIDIYFGDGVVPQGSHKCHHGCLQLAPFFNRHGFFWGAGFSGASVDSMHFEIAKETIQRMNGG
jgi:hypothetical protein